jgi:hypothetical protein
MPGPGRAKGDPLASYVGRYLGVEPEAARRLLGTARATAGSRHLLRVTAFVIATREPVARALPIALRRRALNGLLGPMLSDPRAVIMFVAGRDVTALDRSDPVQCDG